MHAIHMLRIRDVQECKHISVLCTVQTGLTICDTTSPSFDAFFHDAISRCLKTLTNGCCHTESQTTRFTAKYIIAYFEKDVLADLM